MSTLEDQNIGDNLPDELSVLKQRATMMGIQFSNNIGLETLRKKIEDKMEGRAEADAAPQINPLAGETTAQPVKRKPPQVHVVLSLLILSNRKPLY